jgi:phosphoribosylaminoimidazole-succinocarboxamide synthase
MKKIAEGKTKIIWVGPEKNQVAIESKDYITAGDGAKRDLIPGKSRFATETACNCFSLLRKKGITNHFIRRENENTFIAWQMRMIPIEIVIRRVATGSYLKRHPDFPEGVVFPSLFVELFFKDDKLHDPIMVWNNEKGFFKLYDPRRPIMPESYIRNLSPDELFTPYGHVFGQEETQSLETTGKIVFSVLERAWKKLDHTLIDLKIECGWDPSGFMTVGDVIDNDSWRLRRGLKNGQVLDKQIYRDLKKSDPESLETIRQNYARVADLTGDFLYL